MLIRLVEEQGFWGVDKPMSKVNTSSRGTSGLNGEIIKWLIDRLLSFVFYDENKSANNTNITTDKTIALEWLMKRQMFWLLQVQWK